MRKRLETEIAVYRAGMEEGALKAGTTNGHTLESEEHELGIWSGKWHESSSILRGRCRSLADSRHCQHAKKWKVTSWW